MKLQSTVLSRGSDTMLAMAYFWRLNKKEDEDMRESCSEFIDV